MFNMYTPCTRFIIECVLKQFAHYKIYKFGYKITICAKNPIHPAAKVMLQNPLYCVGPAAISWKKTRILRDSTASCIDLICLERIHT